ncbi:hypothetical protein [Planctobacterium marinum]|uniref:hypothetical protein n=1 Tax=Planctobacterium marinum TaxID=1631968 RepID=UPI001E3D91BF|nr:hypothetical protein [Planctobacterium marinum]MCC2608126.1 hypothetical protein [Planctobacterium marinum]
MSLSLPGVVHTLFGLLALILAMVLIAKHQRILLNHPMGKLYALFTAITAGTSLFIFNHGGLNPAHILAVLTLVALLGAIVLSLFKVFGTITPYVQLTLMSSTLLFHLLPAATEVLMRFPVDEPLVENLEDPLLHQTFLVIFILFLLLLMWQIAKLKKKTIYIR